MEFQIGKVILLVKRTVPFVDLLIVKKAKTIFIIVDFFFSCIRNRFTLYFLVAYL